VLLRGARQRCKGGDETWPEAVRQVVAAAFSDDGVVHILQEKMRLCNERSPRAMDSTKIASSVASSMNVARAAGGVGRKGSPSSEASAHRISRVMATNKTGSRSTDEEHVERCCEGIQDDEQTVLPCSYPGGAEKDGDRAPTRPRLQGCH
ncbi:unnamed protein product, partial [Ectocarpus fasciculatus]